MFELFGLEPPQTDTVARAVYRLLDASLEAGAREAALDLVYFPVRILDRGLTWSQPEAFALMKWYPSFYRRAKSYERREERAELAASIAMNCAIHPIEALQLIIPSHEHQGRPRAGLVKAARTATHAAVLHVAKEMIRRADFPSFRETLRRWRLADQDAAEDVELDGAAGVKQLDSARLALAFWIARLAGRGDLADPWPWAQILSQGWRGQLAVDAAERLFGGDATLVDLSDWVLEELPSGEAQVLDTTTDTLRGLLLTLAATPGGRPLDVGPNLYAQRERLLRETEWVKSFAEQAGPNQSRAFETIAEALTAAFANHANVRRTTLLASPLDEERIQAMPQRIAEELRSKFPTRILEASGAIRRTPVRAWPDTFRHSVRFTMPRELLLAGRELEVGTPTVESSLAHGLHRLFEESLITTMQALKPNYRRGPTLLDRIDRAVAATLRGARGFTHILVPWSWQLRTEMTRRGIPVEQRASVGMAYNSLALFEWVGLTDAFVLRLPDALSIRQFTIAGKDVQIEVETLDQEPEDDAPQVAIIASTARSVRVVRKWVRRVALED